MKCLQVFYILTCVVRPSYWMSQCLQDVLGWNICPIGSWDISAHGEKFLWDIQYEGYFPQVFWNGKYSPLDIFNFPQGVKVRELGTSHGEVTFPLGFCAIYCCEIHSPKTFSIFRRVLLGYWLHPVGKWNFLWDFVSFPVGNSYFLLENIFPQVIFSVSHRKFTREFVTSRGVSKFLWDFVLFPLGYSHFLLGNAESGRVMKELAISLWIICGFFFFL